MLNRRNFVGGLLGVMAAPVIIRTPGLLMPIKPLKLDLYKARGAAWVRKTSNLTELLLPNRGFHTTPLYYEGRLIGFV